MMRRLKRRSEGGAVSLLVALVTVALVVPIASMAVDLGMQRVARRDMQAIADLVALDMARHLDGRKFAVIKEANAWESGIRSSIARNVNVSAADEAKLVSGGDKIAVSTEDVTFVAQVPEAFIRGKQGLVVRVTLGRLNAGTGEFEQVTNPAKQVPSAVRVVASTVLNLAFSGASGGASRTAVATSDPLACHRVGSWGADLRTSHSVLDGLFNSIDANIDLDAIHYDALANAQLTLADVFTGVSAGSPDAVLASMISLGDFIDVLVSALPAGSPAIEILDARIGDVLTTGLAAKSIRLGQIVALAGDPDVALAGNVNVLDLVQGAIFAANGDNAIAVPGLVVTVPGLTSVEVKAHVVQSPQIACGFGSTAETSQIDVALGGELLDIPLGFLQPSLRGRIDARVRVANAAATLDSVTCTTAGPQSMSVTMPAPSLARLDLDLDLRVLGLPLTKTTVSTASTGPTGVHELPLPSAYDVPVRTQGSGSLGLPTASQVKASLLGLPLGLLLDPVLLALQPVLQALESALLDQVLPHLGIEVAGADLYAVRTPDCVAPNLRG